MYCYEIQVRSDVDPWYKVSLGIFSEEAIAVASAYNVAPHDATIVYRKDGIEGEQKLLRDGLRGQDEIYLIVQVPFHSEPLPPQPRHQEEKKEIAGDEDIPIPWSDDDEGDYSQWYDRRPGDHEMPDNYPEAVDPEDFAPPYEEDIHDEDYAIGWLDSAIDEVNYEQDHPDEP